ncbi:hypothetical protein SASPL_128278 [Salvia splendens]|uniref:KUP system potassium uptake protein n=1 Tax=Salvia splendens TaxID=180675 RepID=A0A8X8XDH9_SALSN|nr:hypothetical protein SASPL_128278 [Salvia splendens]
MLQKESWRTVFALAYQSLGVVYGDLSTSPLYVYKSTFAEDIQHSETNEEIFGVLSFVFWTLTLVPLVKYVFIVLRADDNGEGGTFALYSLLCRHARVSTLPNGQLADEDLSALEKHSVLQMILLTLALLGACMVIGYGVLTPAISVFSAVSGLELLVAKHRHQYIEVPVVCMILVFLFSLQHFGTHRIGFLFGPVVITWLLCISSIGIYNIFHWNPHVCQALSPYYMYKFLKKTQGRGWMSLGGILLCITGSEAMYADLGHFSQLSIKMAFSFVVYPSLVLAYMGQAAYLSTHHKIENDYPIGKAALAGACDCYTRSCGWKPRHDNGPLVASRGSRYACLLRSALGTRSTSAMHRVWQSALLAIAFMLFFGSIKALYFSAALIKFLEGAWVPVALSFVFLVVMSVWHYCTRKKYEFDVQNKVSLNWLLRSGPELSAVRVRGIGLIHTELVSGIPAILSHFVANLPAFHQVLVFLCIKYVPVPHVRPEERFLVERVGPREYRVYRCIASYGYHDVL